MRKTVAGTAADPAWTERGSGDRLTIFLGRLRHNWGLVLGVVALTVAGAAVLAFSLPSYWRVEIVVMPVPKNSTGNLNLAAVAGGLGGLGALLGNANSTEDEALAVLRSRELFDTYATQQNLLPVLFDSKWDAGSKRWTVDASDVPTLRRGFKLFDSGIRDIDADRRTGIVTMGITWKDRALAAQWAHDLIDLTNAQLRARAIDTAQRNMRYLSDQMRSGETADASNALTAALAAAYERQLQDYMFAKGQKEFAFRIVDPPTYPDDRERVWPQRPVFLALGLILGCLLGVAAALLREAIRSRRRVAHDHAVASMLGDRA